MKKHFSSLFLSFFFLSSCIHAPPQGNDIASMSAPTVDTRLPYPLAVVLAHDIDSRTQIERGGSEKPGVYRVWIPEYNYKPNEFLAQFNDDPFKYFSYPILVLISPPFFSYAWDEVANSYDPESTRALDEKLKTKSRALYEYLDSPATKRYDTYSNEYVWSENKRKTYAKWSKVWGQLRGWQIEYFAPLAGQILSFDYDLSLSLKLLKHPPPPKVVKQQRFESTRHYKAMVKKASIKARKYANYLRKANAEIINKIGKKENLIIYRTFSLYFGPPKVLKTSYDPDARLFGVVIGGKNGGEFDFMLADRIMNDQAPDYEKRLLNASPLIYLRLSKGTLYLDGGYLIFGDGTQERILPYRKKGYVLKEDAVASFPALRSPDFGTPSIKDNARMNREGASIEKDTVYFRGQQ